MPVGPVTATVRPDVFACILKRYRERLRQVRPTGARGGPGPVDYVAPLARPGPGGDLLISHMSRLNPRTRPVGPAASDF